MPLSHAVPEDTHVSLNPLVGLDWNECLASFWELGSGLASRPDQIAAYYLALFESWQDALTNQASTQQITSDRRFHDSRWHEPGLFQAMMRMQLANEKIAHSVIEALPGNVQHKNQIRFLTTALIGAFSPNNFLWTNPVAIQRAIDTRGRSLLDGWKHLVHDIAHNHGMPSQIDTSGLSVGTHLAATKGYVILQTELLELIQFEPQTTRVHATPQLLIPPVVNRYYLADMAPGQSMVEFLLHHGHQVFIISWRNPKPENRDWGLNTYVSGILQAMEAVQTISEESALNLHGICGGARIMAALLGHLANHGQEDQVNCASIIAVNLVTDDDAHGLFASAAAMERARKKSSSAGVLDGADIIHAFNWIHPTELIWKYWINNYLLGNEPPGSEVFYWSSDSTRLPARLHAELLDINQNNLFASPGQLNVLGQPIDLGKVSVDKFVVAGTKDHIAPWTLTYQSAQLFGGKFEFVLNYGGHVPTILNPPGGAKSRYIANPNVVENPHNWAFDGDDIDGSWWNHWNQWIVERSGKLIRAPKTVGCEKFPAISAAPGTYVLEP